MKRISVLIIIAILLMTSCVPLLSAQWTSNPEENTPITTMAGEQALPKIAVDANGYSYISWFSVESGGYHVRLQRLDHDGNTLWPQNGIVVSSEPQESWITDYDLTVDPSGYAVITFTDIRTGQSNPVGYRISPEGEMMWGPTGILLADDTNFDPSPKVCVNTVGNSVFAWQSIPDTGDSQVRLQKISPDGDLLWGDGIILSETGIDYTAPYVEPADNDNVYLIWHKETGPYYAPNRGLYVQKLDENGDFMWASAVEVYAPVPSSPVVYLQMCRDDSGGIVFAWYRSVDSTRFCSYIEHMDADGTITMPANGVLASTSSSRNHMYPAPAFLSQTQEIVLFFSEQDLNQNMRGIYAQKFDLQGNRLWSDDGLQLIGLSNNDYLLFTADGKDNTAICIYQAAIGGTNPKMQAVMLDDQGNFVWPQHFIDLSGQSQKLHNVMSNYYMGQWVAVWEDQRNDAGDIYAQNIQPDGTLGVVISVPPVAFFTWSPLNPRPQTAVLFDASASYDPDGSIVLYEWDWDHDGVYDESHTTPTATHEFGSAGDYSVTLRVTDNSSVSTTISHTVTVVNHAPPKPIIGGPTEGDTNHAYTFWINLPMDPDGDEMFLKVDWGDGNMTDWLGPYTSGQNVSVSHTWTQAGVYSIRAMLKDTYGAESDWSDPLEITINAADELSVELKGGFGVAAIITNTGESEITNVHWEFTLTGGLILLGKEKSGNITAIDAGNAATVRDLLVLGFGTTTIQVDVTCTEGLSATASASGTVFLFFVGVK